MLKIKENEKMKKMKQVAILVLAVLAMMLMACTGSEKSVTYVLETKDTSTKIVYVAKGDIVQTQTTYTEMAYTVIGVTTQEEAKIMVEPIVEMYQGIEGLTHSIDYEEDMLIEKLEVDYTKANIEDIKDLFGSVFDGDAKNGARISLKRSISLLEEQGYTEEK